MTLIEPGLLSQLVARAPIEPSDSDGVWRCWGAGRDTLAWTGWGQGCRSAPTASLLRSECQWGWAGYSQGVLFLKDLTAAGYLLMGCLPSGM